ncbi:tetratricopeptide repeat protein [Dactylosporangium siamense]|uniref:tetratricopeptide repeat protein n=1 Tax=Dactylosporangium siamense TaxID=685454 RepID=UPI001941B053|nr:tetratricopeptide repeat protein [Dactylosporangium siamense]
MLQAPGWLVVTSGGLSASASLVAPFIWPAVTARRQHGQQRWSAWTQMVDVWPWAANVDVEVGTGPVTAGVLDARRALVRFRLRRVELRTLLDWCTDPAAAPVHVVSGPAGIGKTRLAVQLATELAIEPTPWVTGAAYPGCAAAAVQAADALRRPALVVLDQADTRLDLVPMFAALASAGPSVRVLLLARTATDGQWWQQLRQSVANQQQAPWLRRVGHLPLLSLGGSAHAQQQLFGKAIDALAHHFDVRFQRPPQLGTAAPDAPIAMLHAAALVAVLRAQQRRSARPVDADETVWKELVDHEAQVWLAAADRYDAGLLPDTQRQTVACAALLGAKDEADAIELLRRIPDLHGTDRERRHRVAEWLHAMYPGVPPQWLSTIEPQQLAERLIFTEIARDDAFTEQLLADIPDHRMARILVLLGTAAPTHPWASRRLGQILRRQPDVALPVAIQITSGTLLLDQIIADCVDQLALPSGLVDELWRALPNAESTATLLRTIVAVTRRRLDQPALTAVDEARRQHDLANALRWADETLTAQHHAERAVELWRDCSQLDPRHRHELVAALRTLAALYRLSARYAEAVSLGRQAVDICQDLSRVDPDANRRLCAQAFGALAAALRDAGHTEEAVQVWRQAVALWQDLSHTDPDVNARWHADALKLFGSALREAGQTEEAVRVGRQAVDLWQQLSDTDPDANRRLYADALNSFGNTLSEAGQVEEAVRVSRQAADLWQDLYGADPDANGRTYAAALRILSAALGDAGQVEEAVRVSRQAVDLWQELCQLNPGFQDQFAGALQDHGSALSDAGQIEEAVRVSRQAVDLWQELSRADPDANQRWYALGLKGLGTVLRRAGQVDEAVRVGRQAADLWQELSRADPDANQRWYANAMLALSNAWLEHGNVAEARSAAQGAVAQLRALTIRKPYDVHRRELANAQRWLANFA